MESTFQWSSDRYNLKRGSFLQGGVRNRREKIGERREGDKVGGEVRNRRQLFTIFLTVVEVGFWINGGGASLHLNRRLCFIEIVLTTNSLLWLKVVSF